MKIPVQTIWGENSMSKASKCQGALRGEGSSASQALAH